MASAKEMRMRRRQRRRFVAEINVAPFVDVMLVLVIVLMITAPLLTFGVPVDLPQADREHPLKRWRREAGLGEPESTPRPYPEWLEVEDRRLGRRKES